MPEQRRRSKPACLPDLRWPPIVLRSAGNAGLCPGIWCGSSQNRAPVIGGNVRVVFKVFLLSILPLAVGDFAQSPGSAQAGKARFSLAISTATPAVPAGSPLKIEILLTNTSSQTLSFSWAGEFPYELDVRNANGGTVPETEKGRHERALREGMSSFSTFDYQVKPGARDKTECIISELYDMSKPGVYFIQAQRLGGIQQKVKSNVLKVTLAG